MSPPINNRNLVLATLFIPACRSFAPPHPTASLYPFPTSDNRRRRLAQSNNDNDDIPSWRQNADYWEERERRRLASTKSKPAKPARNKTPAPAVGDHIGFTSGHRPVDRSPWDPDRDSSGNGNTFAHLYEEKSTDEFKLPFESQSDIVERMQRNTRAAGMKYDYRRDVTENGGVPEWFGKSTSTAVNNIVDGRAMDGRGMKSARDEVSGELLQLNDESSFQMRNGNDFPRPYDGPSADDAAVAAEVVPEWFGSNTRAVTNNDAAAAIPVDNRSAPQVNHAAVDPYGEGGKRHSFQMSSTDDFRKPYGMQQQTPSSSQQQQQQQQAPSSSAKRILNIKAPFQTSATDDFKRPSDTGTSSSAPQQPLYAEFAESSAWKNSVGRDAYRSTQLPNSAPLGGSVGKEGYRTNPSQSSAVLTVENDGGGSKERQWGFGGGGSGKEMLLRSIRWVDPTDDAPQHPSSLTRMFITVLATVATRHLHLINGFSPVLASSTLSFLVSTCVDKRLGQVALCGAMAGMSGGHLMPTISAALLLGATASLCYEVLIGRNNLFAGVGGRAGAVAFLASSIIAKYRGINGAGRKMRRGMWKAGVGPSSIVVSMIVFHAVGALATILLRQSSEDDGAADPVRASSVAGIIGSLILSDPTSLMALYGGSFVGMSLPSRLMRGNLSRARIRQSATSLMLSFVGGGAIAGLIHAMTIHGGYWNGGWGGKVGLCAFAGCWVYRGLDNMTRFNKR